MEPLPRLERDYPCNSGNDGPNYGSGFGQHFGHTVPFSDRVGTTLSNGTIGLNREAA